MAALLGSFQSSAGTSHGFDGLCIAQDAGQLRCGGFQSLRKALFVFG
jgi:hypothetical protein